MNLSYDDDRLIRDWLERHHGADLLTFDVVDRLPVAAVYHSPIRDTVLARQAFREFAREVADDE